MPGSDIGPSVVTYKDRKKFLTGAEQKLMRISEQLESIDGDINNKNGESYKVHLEEQKKFLDKEILANIEFDDIQRQEIESDFAEWTTDSYVDERDIEPDSTQQPIPYLDEFTNTENIEIFK